MFFAQIGMGSVEKLGSGKTTQGVEFLGVKWIGLNASNGQKLLASVVLIATVMILSALIRLLLHQLSRGRENVTFITIAKQFLNIITTFVVTLGVLSIWFDDPSSLATALGLVMAGVAFALQKVITSFAGYFVILRGKVFRIGDRIAIGNVRGDVIDLNLTQTTVMEMGQPPSVQNADPDVWVRSRQYTGRVVSVPNAKIFEESIFNYTRELSFLWEEMSIPIPYTTKHAQREHAEQILLNAARKHGVDAEDMEKDALAELAKLYPVEKPSLEPSVYWTLTDNWIQLSVRFLTRSHGVRSVKDQMSRDIIIALDNAGIGIASATFELVGLPKIDVKVS